MKRKSKSISPDTDLVLGAYVKLMRASSSITAKMHHHLSASDLTVSQFGILECLLHLGPLCQKELAGKILKTSGNITMVVDNLQKRGLVARNPDVADRRRLRVSLTPDGKALIQDLFPKHAEIARQVFSVLDRNECQQLSALLKKLGTRNVSV